MKTTITFQCVKPDVLKQWLSDGHEIALLDVREAGLFGLGHLLFAVPLPYSRLELDIVRLVPRKATRIVLVDDNEHIAVKAAARLADLGYSHVHILQGGNPAWKQAGYELFCGVNVPSKAFGELVEEQLGTPHISAPDLFALQASKQKLLVIDGRPYSEYQKMNIPGAVSCPNGELAYRWHKLVPDDDTIVVINCAGRTRSILGAQTLLNLGVKNPVFALENGTQGWVLNDFTLEHGSTRKYPTVSADDERMAMTESARRLANSLSVPFVTAQQVLEWRQAGGDTIYLCDVRTEEEFQANTLTGAQHTPGGQLIQATDQYIGVQGAQLVLFDNDGIRAPIIASWLRQLGHNAYVLSDTLDVARDVLQASSWMGTYPQPDFTEITAQQLHELSATQPVVVIDVRSSAAYQQAHLPSSQWGIRPLLSDNPPDPAAVVVLVADDVAIAQLAASELPQGITVYLLQGGISGWQEAGYPCNTQADYPVDAQRIDYLFFVHDRHDGNKAAARQYLAWELGLVAQLDQQERAVFSPMKVTQG